jgi:hypothetical protein
MGCPARLSLCIICMGATAVCRRFPAAALWGRGLIEDMDEDSGDDAESAASVYDTRWECGVMHGRPGLAGGGALPCALLQQCHALPQAAPSAHLLAGAC